ncbi:MAG: EAL domain-containing protein [Campylobacterota bacterium]|nr:EAL domain-containing protein [Campylobacterota bacterium]
MYKLSTDSKLFFTILTTLVFPILLGLWLQSYGNFRFVSLPFHSFLEATGAISALTMALIVFVMHYHTLIVTAYHRASIALISMGVFDAFHSMVYPGELFVWLHSMAVFSGGILFGTVWFNDFRVSKRKYTIVPTLFLTITVITSLISIIFPQFVPQMLTKEGAFTNFANFLNLVGGVMFVIASFYYIKKYLETHNRDDLLFTGHTLLFGTAGILFFFSNLWDAQWWLWHILRFFAYMIALYFMVKLFHETLMEIYSVKNEYEHMNNALANKLQSLEEYKKAYDEISIISVGDLKGNIKYVNANMLKTTGYTKDELVGMPHSLLRDKETPKELFIDMWNTIKSGDVWYGMLKNRKKSGEAFYINLTIIPLHDSNGKIIEYLGVRTDITELIKSKKELKKQFNTDILTSLFNRSRLLEDMLKIEKPVIAAINLNGFKTYNDFFGSSFGDEIIIKVGDIILEKLHPLGYSIYRNHADEFIVMKNYSEISRQKYIDEISTFVKYINNKKVTIDDEDVDLSASCGISFGYADVLHVDLALKEAKKSKSNYIVYNELLTTTDEYMNNIKYSKILKKAIDSEKVIAQYQPIYNLHTKSIEKYETLIRILDEDDKIIYPNNFLDISKQTRLYHELTKRVIKKGISIASSSSFEISINITADDILDYETAEFIINTIKGINFANRVVFELVESEGIENFSRVKEFISTIKSYGCKIAIDDFGTGYSNFDYLIKLEADYIKIDGSLIKNIDNDKSHYAVVETIAEFARKNSLKTIAEFVHSKEVLDKLYELNIDYAQGFFIGKPSKEVKS